MLYIRENPAFAISETTELVKRIKKTNYYI